MKIFTRFSFVLFSLLSFNLAIANNAPPERASDSLTLGQAFINLSLTEKYFDTLQKQRIAKILQFEENELASIKDSGFIKKNDDPLSFHLLTPALWQGQDVVFK